MFLSIGLLIGDPTLRSKVRTLLESLPAQIIFDGAALDSEQLRRTPLDVVFVDSRPGGQPLDYFVRRVKGVSGNTAVVVVETSPRAELLAGWRSAGADDFVLPPLDAGLLSALRRLESQLDAATQEPPGKVLGFVSAKGGCGATAVACHLAAALQKFSSGRILLVDLDLDVGMVGFLMRTGTARTVLDAARNLPHPDPAQWAGIVGHVGPNLDVLAAPKWAPAAELSRPEPFAELFRSVRSMYAWVIADLGRGLNPLAKSVLGDLDQLFVVTNVNVPALHEARQLLQRVTQSGLASSRVRLVLNRVPHPAAGRAEEIRPLLGAAVACEIGEDQALDEAYAEGKLAAAGTLFGRDLQRLAASIAGVPEPKRNRWSWLPSWRKPIAV